MPVDGYCGPLFDGNFSGWRKIKGRLEKMSWLLFCKYSCNIQTYVLYLYRTDVHKEALGFLLQSEHGEAQDGTVGDYRGKSAYTGPGSSC